MKRLVDPSHAHLQESFLLRMAPPLGAASWTMRPSPSKTGAGSGGPPSKFWSRRPTWTKGCMTFWQRIRKRFTCMVTTSGKCWSTGSPVAWPCRRVRRVLPAWRSFSRSPAAARMRRQMQRVLQRPWRSCCNGLISTRLYQPPEGNAPVRPQGRTRNGLICSRQRMAGVEWLEQELMAAAEARGQRTRRLKRMALGLGTPHCTFACNALQCLDGRRVGQQG
mmetsp:Transcript_32684/g.81236  ORF Transcript_32684/g.81236 Transcript_32684/m.81236 type:complete len:221 (-) Transcript_32684:343-1005(-)